MKLKVQHVFDATLVVAQIIRENRPMPPKASFRLARLHMKLLPEFTTIAARRDALIEAYDHHPMMWGPKTKEDPLGETSVPSPEFSVPLDKMDEFNAAWAEIAAEEIEVAVEPIALDCFGDAAISAQEFIALGDLVTE